MSSPTCARLTIDGRVATVTIATEGGLNVMSTDAVRSLREAVDQVAANPKIRFTVLRAEGKVFVAGANIKEMAGFDADKARAFGELGSGTCDAIAALPSITLAALQGAALGGGCEIALACDFRLATENVKIGLPETTLGLIPGWGGVPRAVKLLGPTMAKRLIFSGQPISANEAASIGLIDEVVGSEAALDEAIKRWCERFVKGSPKAIALAKRALRDGDDIGAFADCFKNDQSREGMSAFSEKRAAAWTNIGALG